MKKIKYKPEINVIDRYYGNDFYNDCIADSIEESLSYKKAEEYILILSAHSIPKMYADRGDPYQSECEYNVEILREKLNSRGLYFKDIILSYQSKVGKLQWLEPSTIDIIKKYRGEKIIIYPLAFTIDNSETIYEIDIEYREEAMNNYNIKDFILCPCLNDKSSFAKTIISLSENISNMNFDINYDRKIV